MRKSIIVAAVGALLASQSFAADQSMAVIPASSWDGFYAGLNFGTAWGATDWSDPTGILAAPNESLFPASGSQMGLLGGLTLGYNWPVGRHWVVGVEGEIDASTLTGNAVCSNPSGFFGWTCHSEIDALASLDARIGYAEGSTLLFVKGGPSYAHQSLSISAGDYYVPGPSIESTQNLLGGNAGLGVEQALGDGLSLKSEFTHYRFGKQSLDSSYLPVQKAYGATARQSFNALKFGINYHFGPSPAVAEESPPIRDFSIEFGTRAGWTTGNFRYDLFDLYNKSAMNSRLTWPGTGTMTEVFGRIDHHSGAFLKGFVGGIAFADGADMYDEDFFLPPDPYSKTVHIRKNSQSLYATIDVGYAFMSGGWRAGPFVGYSYYDERQNAYGCTQIATNPFICEPPGSPSPVVGPDQLMLSRRFLWNSARLGVAGDVWLAERLKLSAEAAWLPWLSTTGSEDNHWMRPDINPLGEDAEGSGYQLEATLSYFVTDRMSIGIGTRRWRMQSEGTTQFPFVGIPSSPIREVFDRTMVFGQVSYTFGDLGNGKNWN
ncbi:outer membrane beta-barrel protein [Magnetospirillum molischianum]|uniref:Outer membrane protein beta-barrel domain-containing protein n=1 Tax=Magnetospirillum molischianum DSM 120 TaxID=1150626 RepID=H8FP03_MAGML|nr:outer membrane beta-barrel protein [Magnetospirillum molischianum]CCG40091.1 conserved exported hypothetical protein [Magnetospirillum molischianum DSM 120]